MVGLLVCYHQYGFIPGADVPFPVSGVSVSIWHLIAMGFGTGYVMALVGQASGLFSLAYSMSVLNFNSIAVSPTSLVTTFLNPFGALLGFWRARQWNLDLALWLCIGAVLGSTLGPFLRVYVFYDPIPFKALIGAVMVIMSIDLWLELTPWYRRRVAQRIAGEHKQSKGNNGSAAAPMRFHITTICRSFRHVTITYGNRETTLSVQAMLAIGFIVGIAGTTLGIGGGFLLVPALVVIYRLPMYVVVAASIPYVIVLSLTGLFAYLVTLPAISGISTPIDWAFGLFVASGAIPGAWLASKTQRFIPDIILKPMLGIITGVVGFLYVLNYFGIKTISL